VDTGQIYMSQHHRHHLLRNNRSASGRSDQRRSEGVRRLYGPHQAALAMGGKLAKIVIWQLQYCIDNCKEIHCTNTLTCVL